METNDVNARLAALQARRQPQPTARPAARTNPMTGRSRKHHPAHKARIATGAMSVVAMFGITGFMAAHDASAASSSSASVNGSANGSANGSSVTANGSATSQAVGAATAATATTQAATVTKGS